MQYIPYNSHKSFHKYPFGAVAQGEKVFFNLILPREMRCRGVTLLMRRDDERQMQRSAMSWNRMQGDNEEWWHLELETARTGLFWYRFEYETDWGRMTISRVSGGAGGLTGEGSEWQLTVYDRGLKTPEWLKGGIIYQIFPDRFYFSGEEKTDVPSDRLLRSDWGGLPQWEPDSAGRITSYDYFCGDLRGIALKLPYLKKLGVNCIYLNPIFEAHSNHRYNTADFMKIDPLLGDEESLRALCKKAEENGIRIVADGVFNHTGDDSVYFNKENRYPEKGAYNSEESPYYGWFRFEEWPDKYKSWWGIDILPEVDETNESFAQFITGENGVLEHWMDCGIYGWRLDVADELPDGLLEKIYGTVKRKNPDAYLLGEVWEDASNKVSYGERRKYLLGGQLDSVMNYPFAQAIMMFLKTGVAESFMECVMQIAENYPKPCLDTLMNHIGTHDTARALTVLTDPAGQKRNAWRQGKRNLTKTQCEKGIKLMMLAAALQYTLPGVPGVYYGDEAGMTGGDDPYNRCCYPWGGESERLLGWYTKLGEIRRSCKCFARGNFLPVSATLGCVAYARECESDAVLIIANRNEHPIDYRMPPQWSTASVIAQGERRSADTVRVDACSAAILYKN